MKRLFCRVLAVFAVVLAIGYPVSAEAGREVLYFYENYCESCSPEEDFAEYFRSLTGVPLEDFNYTAYNVAHSSGRKALEETAERFGLTGTTVPLVIVDGVAYSGASEMERGLPEASLSWGTETESTIVYLYVPACESCARAVAVLEDLPESVMITRGAIEIESKVVIERVDVSAHPGVASRLFDVYGVPDEQRITPSVFFADRYLSGAESIEKNLAAMVSLGWAAGGVELPASGDTGSPGVLSLTGTLGAGLVAGLNTCALSMLLLFLSLIIESRKNAGLLAGCFLGAKFVCYLVIGYALMEVLQRFNPGWLQPLARWILTGMGAVLIAMNLWDAWQARRENFGGIRNQLPTGLRSRLHRLIRGMTGSRVMIPATIALGVLVALGEFLCAGQLYLMQLLSDIQSGSGAHVLGLPLYCLAFIAPSVVLSALVLRGGSHRRVSAFLAEHMAAAKLLTAAAMLALILFAWLL